MFKFKSSKKTRSPRTFGCLPNLNIPLVHPQNIRPEDASKHHPPFRFTPRLSFFVDNKMMRLLFVA